MRRETRSSDDAACNELDWTEDDGTEPQLAVGTCEIVKVPDDRIDQRDSVIVQIVHDLKNPLSVIALEMALLRDKLDQTELGGAVSRVTQNLAYLDRMVHDLLDAGAIDAECFAIRRRRTELRALLQRVIDRAVASRDRSRVYLEAPRPLWMLIDDLRIERVVVNLLHNALKYSPPSSGVLVQLDAGAVFARVSVIDAGPGLSSSERALIFDKFRRATGAHEHEGTGLGLYVSKRIIEAHDGTLGVESVCGVGSRFFFDLPIENT